MPLAVLFPIILLILLVIVKEAELHKAMDISL